MKLVETELRGVIAVEPRVFRDDRGFFLESYHEEKFAAGGIDVRFVQDNHSRSALGTLRGLHLQRMKTQGKLVRVVFGEVFDVAVDVRVGSPNFGRWVGVTLSSENFRQLYIPPGFAHGFCVMSEIAEVEYKCTAFYEPADELTLKWNDPEININWPVASPLLSAKDQSGKSLAEAIELLPRYAGTDAGV
ncbi:MAG: dTDP-4-dehydrorhamnose 3,5-epimerase [Acidobacteriota bacterium]